LQAIGAREKCDCLSLCGPVFEEASKAIRKSQKRHDAAAFHERIAYDALVRALSALALMVE